MHLHALYICILRIFTEKVPTLTCQVQFGFWLQELLDVKQDFGKMLFCV